MFSNSLNQPLNDDTESHITPSGLEGNKTTITILSNPSPVFPPPYSPPSTTNNGTEDEPSKLDNVLYKKMLSLESMISDIHSSVIDNSFAYKDVSIQLSEINESMKQFQEETSIRLRKEFSKNNKLESIFPESFDNENSSVFGDQTSVTEYVEKEDVCYERVCNLVETLINDANSVLGASSTSDINSDSDESSSIASLSVSPKLPKKIFRSITLSRGSGVSNKKKAESVSDINFSRQFSQDSNTSKQQEMSKRVILPLLKDAEDIDIERLALISTSAVQEGSHQNSSTLHIDRSDLARLLLDEDPSRLLVSLIYWVVMFTIGSILFDSSLCNTAGTQIINVIKLFSKQRTNQRRRSLTIEAIECPIVFTQSFSPQFSNSSIISQRRRSI